MPTEITAVQCASCKRLHPKEGKYIIVDIVQARQKASDGAKDFNKQRMESISFKDVIVCDSDCFCSLVTMKEDYFS